MKYNGKELQSKEFGDGSGLEWYDYGARMYDVQVGRCFVQDRFSERYEAYAPYHYVLNNPISSIDINGDTTVVLSAPTGVGGAGHMAALIQNEKGKYQLYSKNGTTKSSGISG